MRNSRKDPEMVAAANKLEDLLREAARDASAAADDWANDPRWCGFPGPDASKNYGSNYPRQIMWTDRESIRVQVAHDAVKDEATAKHFHSEAMQGVVRALKSGMTPRTVNPGGLTPREYLDQTRGVLRYIERLDQVSSITTAFALLECRKKGRMHDENDHGGNWPFVPNGIMVQDYEYHPLSQTHLDAFDSVIRLSKALRKAFDHAALALLPKDPSPDEMKFLNFMADRGGTARNIEVIEWLKQENIHYSGQDPSAGLLRKYCDKSGVSGSRKPWVVRPEALALVGR